MPPEASTSPLIAQTLSQTQNFIEKMDQKFREVTREIDSIKAHQSVLLD